MSPGKIKIAANNEAPPYWRPLMPIVKFCLDRGCKIDGRTEEEPFYEDRNGASECRIYGPISIDDILENFVLPDHYETTDRSISYEKFRTYIYLSPLKDLEQVLQDRKAYKERMDKRLMESRKRRSERDKACIKQEGGQ